MADKLAEVKKIQADPTLTDAEKAKRRQALFAGKWAPAGAPASRECPRGRAGPAPPGPRRPVWDGGARRSDPPLLPPPRPPRPRGPRGRGPVGAPVREAVGAAEAPRPADADVR